MKNSILGFNLLPEELKEEFNFTQKIKKTSRYLRMILGLLGLFSLFLLFNLIYLQYLQRTLSEELSLIAHEPSAIAVEQSKRDIQAFNNELNALAKPRRSFDWPLFLNHLALTIPDSITLERLSVQQRSSGVGITLEGKAPQRQDLINFENLLRSSPYVSNVVSPLSNYRKTQDITFQIILDIKNSPGT